MELAELSILHVDSLLCKVVGVLLDNESLFRNVMLKSVIRIGLNTNCQNR
jgi:hypothetical protein